MSNFDEIIKIRPHHGMCIYFFQGEGYSSEFVQGMSRIISALNKGAIIELTDSTDNICAFCPNNLNGICTSADRVREFDKRVLDLCGLEIGDILSWKEFSLRVKRSIIDIQKMKNICGDCKWAYICHKIKKAETFGI